MHKISKIKRIKEIFHNLEIMEVAGRYGKMPKPI